MPRVIVQTDDGREIDRFEIEGAQPFGGTDAEAYVPNSVWRNLVGRYQAPFGWLGRAIRDAVMVEGDRDPERLSEKAMRHAGALGWGPDSDGDIP